MSKDMMIFNLCDHMINGEKYNIEDCPLCKGKSYYYDIAFNQKGEIETCEDSIKLQQEVLKILTDIKGGNRFFPNYGNELTKDTIGKKKNSTTQQRIQIALYDTLQYLKNIQIIQFVVHSINKRGIIGIDDRVGSIEVGKDADIVIWDNNPFEINSHVLYTIIDGKIVYRK